MSLHYFPIRPRLERILASDLASLLNYSDLRVKDEAYLSDISDGLAYKNIRSMLRPGSKLFPLVGSWDGFELWRKAPNSKSILPYFLLLIFLSKQIFL